MARFESRMASFVGVKGAAAVSSGAAALHLALLALKVGPGCEVIVPSYVCPAVLSAVLYTGATPVVADIDPGSFNLSPEDAKRRLSAKTRAVIVPHMFGLPADLDALGALGVPVVEDLALALGSRRHGRRAGSFGTLAVCSFYATKMMATGEGGMVLGSDGALLAEIRDLRAMDEKEDFRVRFNYKMTDMQAALGLSQLRKLTTFVARRREIADLYSDVLRRLGLPVPCAPGECEPVWYRYVLHARRRRGALHRGDEEKRGGLPQARVQAAAPLPGTFRATRRPRMPGAGPCRCPSTRRSPAPRSRPS